MENILSIRNNILNYLGVMFFSTNSIYGSGIGNSSYKNQGVDFMQKKQPEQKDTQSQKEKELIGKQQKIKSQIGRLEATLKLMERQIEIEKQKTQLDEEEKQLQQRLNNLGDK